jgi:hypothetical protein
MRHVALFGTLPFCLAHVMEKAVTPLHMTRNQGGTTPKQTCHKSRCTQSHTEVAGKLGVSVLVDRSCLGRAHSVVVVNVDTVDLLDPGVAAGGEEKAAQLGWSTRQAGC